MELPIRNKPGVLFSLESKDVFPLKRYGSGSVSPEDACVSTELCPAERDVCYRRRTEPKFQTRDVL